MEEAEIYSCGSCAGPLLLRVDGEWKTVPWGWLLAPGGRRQAQGWRVGLHHVTLSLNLVLG